jgi:hypothetical protein
MELVHYIPRCYHRNEKVMVSNGYWQLKVNEISDPFRGWIGSEQAEEAGGAFIQSTFRLSATSRLELWLDSPVMRPRRGRIKRLFLITYPLYSCSE